MLRRMAAAVLAINYLLIPALTSHATETEKPFAVAFSSKFRNVEYLFTEHVEKAAQEEGANYDFAIREVGWELISAVGRACHSVRNIQAIVIDRIHFRERHSLVAIGVMADQEYHALHMDNAATNATLKQLYEAFEREHIRISQPAEPHGIELALAAE